MSTGAHAESNLKQEPDLPADSWEGCTATELAAFWSLPVVHLYHRIGSTNDVAHALAHTGAATGTVVLAEEQVAGRGRGARSWASPAGLGLWISLILKDVGPMATEALPLRVGLSVAKALDEWSSSPVQLKWPNDLILSGKKLGGILCEASWDGTRLHHVVAGIGINVLQAGADFPTELQSTATSLRQHAKKELSRFDIVTAILRALLKEWSGPDLASEALPERFRARDALAGKRIVVSEPMTGRLLAEGLAAGVDERGSLLVQNGGALRVIRSGTVRLAS